MSEDRIFETHILGLAAAAPGLPEGVSGWTAESARRALDSLRSSKVAVVAIDVYDRVAWGFALSGDSWACHRGSAEPSLDFAMRSRREAQEWISALPREDVLFGIEFSTQDVAAEASGHRGFLDEAG